VLVPAFAEVSVVQTKHLRCQPGRHVDTVSDMADGNIVFGLAGIEAGPHGAGDLAVESGNGVGAAR